MKTLTKSALLAPVMAMALAGASLAADDSSSKTESSKDGNAVIYFANLPHTIDSWQNDGTKGIYLRVGLKKWYYATFMAPCIDLPFTEKIGIGSDATGRVDKFSSIVVPTATIPQRCYFKTVDEVDGPPKKSKDKDKDKASAD